MSGLPKLKMLASIYSDAGICCSGTTFPPQHFIPSVLWKTERETVLADGRAKRFFSLKCFLKQSQTCEMDSSPDDFSDKGSIDTHRNARSRIHAI